MQILVLDHPLAHHKLALLRDRHTSVVLFRSLTEELGLMLAVEAMRNLSTTAVKVETPLEMMGGQMLAQMDPALVPVLRAGLGLVPSFLKLLPTAKVGHIGMYRDHATLKPVPYYRNFSAHPRGTHRLRPGSDAGNRRECLRGHPAMSLENRKVWLSHVK